MQVGGVSLDLTLIMHGKAFRDYLTDHLFLSLESESWGTGYRYPCLRKILLLAVFGLTHMMCFCCLSFVSTHNVLLNILNQ